MAEVLRSKRTRRLSSYVRVFDKETRAAILNKKLDALEQDNAHEPRGGAASLDDDDDEYVDHGSDDEAPSKHKKKKKKKSVGGAASTQRAHRNAAAKPAFGAAQKCKTLPEIIDEAEYHRYPSWVPTYVSIAAAPSRYPPRRFCSITGYRAKYKCAVTGDYLGSVSAVATHRETRLKGLV